MSGDRAGLLLLTCIVSYFSPVPACNIQLANELKGGQACVDIRSEWRVTWLINGYIHWEHIGSDNRTSSKTPICSFGRGAAVSSGSLRVSAAEESRGVSSSVMVSSGEEQAVSEPQSA